MKKMIVLLSLLLSFNILAEDLRIGGQYTGLDQNGELCDLKLKRVSPLFSYQYFQVTSVSFGINEKMAWEIYTNDNLDWKNGAVLEWENRGQARQLIYKAPKKSAWTVFVRKFSVEKNGEVLVCANLHPLRR